MRLIFLTGATGAIGPQLIAELLRADHEIHVIALLRSGRPELPMRLRELHSAVARYAQRSEVLQVQHRVMAVSGDIACENLCLSDADAEYLRREVEVVVHAAADSRFSAPWKVLNRVNVDGTRNLLALAKDCEKLSHVVVVSTTCVCGTQNGVIPETLFAVAPDFINDYERTKWDAEQIAAASGLPIHIARLSTCIGAEADGHVDRLGAIHRVIQWCQRGLVPFLPGRPDTPLDLVATDTAAKWLARSACIAPAGIEVHHVAAGRQAMPLSTLLGLLIDAFRDRYPRWRDGDVPSPLIVDRETFARFRETVIESRDALLNSVLSAADCFLPTLLHPKQFDTIHAEGLWGGELPLGDLSTTLERVVDQIIPGDRQVALRR